MRALIKFVIKWHINVFRYIIRLKWSFPNSILYVTMAGNHCSKCSYLSVLRTINPDYFLSRVVQLRDLVHSNTFDTSSFLHILKSRYRYVLRNYKLRSIKYKDIEFNTTMNSVVILKYFNYYCVTFLPYRRLPYT